MLSPFTFVTAGQCLIKSDLRVISDTLLQQLTAIIKTADLAFANFENVILGNDNCWPTKENFCSGVSSVTLDALQAMGFSALSLANNHAFDLGPGGILATLQEVQKRSFLHAGTGSDLTEATQPGYADYPFGKVALIAMHAAGVTEAQTCRALNSRKEYHLPARPGVNVITRSVSEDSEIRFTEEDASRHLEAIGQAKRKADFVMVYIHIHNPPEQLPKYYREFSKQCIDAGANIVIGHGTPVFQGIEVYRNQPIFYNISNLIFHTYQPDFWYKERGEAPWESFLTRINFDANGEMARLEAHPVVLGNPAQLVGANLKERTSSYPVLANPHRGEKILQKLVAFSRAMNTTLTIENNIAYWEH